ncbi:NF-kappa-B inhibitor cactus isoform X2 [Lycorma delicatula]|uniref:NF-kappa-B inhibitor cactus isoform X2 n=1 Tax=Lycorma delicatula TaxID=130591 RepID=UPI003F518EDC
MSKKDARLPEHYCSSDHSKPSYKDENDGLTWKQSGESVSSKSLQSNSSYDKSCYDSGFISGAITSSEQCSEENPSSQKSKEFDNSGEFKSEEKIMRLDSGVDVGLDDRFNTLSLKDSPINDLNTTTSSKSKSEISCTNISVPYESRPDLHHQDFSSRSVQHTSDSKKSSVFLSWEIYFQQDEDGDTQLHIAILHCFIEVVYSLIKMVPHPKYLDIRNDIRQTPLHLAVLTGQPHIIRWLLSEGASPDVLDNHGNTALHLAVSTQDINCVNALTLPVSSDSQSTIVKSSAPVYINQYNYDGMTCLHLAVREGNLNIVKCLLEYGADVNARELKCGLTPLHLAIREKNEAVCQFLLNYCRDSLDLEMPTYGGITAYQMAGRVLPTVAVHLNQLGAIFHPFDDSDDSDYDESTDSDDDEMLERPGYNSFNKMNGSNGVVNVAA